MRPHRYSPARRLVILAGMKQSITSCPTCFNLIVGVAVYLLAQTAAGADQSPGFSHARVNDAANILVPFGPRIGRMADGFSTDLGIDVHVVTSLDGRTPIETQATKAFEQRQVARKSPTGGLLVILDPKLGSARIEVGYSLEGVMTDLHMSRVAHDQLAPYVSYGSAGMAVMDVMHYLRDCALMAAVRGDLNLPEDLKKTPDYLRYKQYLSGGAGARSALSKLPTDGDLKRPVKPERRASYAPGRSPQESVASFVRATRDLAGDPTLELFTEGSRLMRKLYPLAPFEEWQRADSLEASKPLEYLIERDYAVATSRKPAMGFTPVLMHREQGLWRVDLVETWKNLFFNAEGNYYLRNANTPYLFGLKQFGSADYDDIDALPLVTTTIAGDLARLEGRKDVVSQLRRAELWFRNGFVFPPALVNYEAALATAPNDPLVLETFGSRAQYLGFPELAIPMLEKVGRGVEFDIARAYEDLGSNDAARFWIQKVLREDPFDGYALEWMEYLAKRGGDKAALAAAEAESARVAKLPGRLSDPVVLFFYPKRPVHDPTTTMNIGGTTVYDHSHFGVTLQNTSGRNVQIESVQLFSRGNASASGLGDIKDYWTYKSGKNTLEAGERIYFERDWGFTVKTGHQHVRYVFRTCWHGIDAAPPVRQCRTQWVDTLPAP
jgi:tetratricopeptide (TPR) repeat protein